MSKSIAEKGTENTNAWSPTSNTYDLYRNCSTPVALCERIAEFFPTLGGNLFVNEGFVVRHFKFSLYSLLLLLRLIA
jgi:hypothetical protein